MPQSAIDFADQFGEQGRELVLRLYTSGIAMALGTGTGLAAAAITAIAGRVRQTRR